MSATIEHLAIIMDGNGRWARARGLPRTAGHRAGLKAVRTVLQSCEPYRIANLTLFAFSSENWKRPQGEVKMLMDLFVTTIQKELDELAEKDIKLRFIGDVDAFEPRLRHRIQHAEYRTSDNKGMRLNIAVNYGGRWDIVQAARQVARRVQMGKLAPEDISCESFTSFLCLADTPEPDLLIRTGGESRISNFLTWQLAYSELYFTDCLWPDFDEEQFGRAMTWYAGRQRRFGRTPEQVNGGDHHHA